MKKFIVELFSNRFGIILAAINLCYFAATGLHSYPNLVGKIYICINLPAIASTLLSLGGVKIFQHDLSFQTSRVLGDVLFPVLVVLQWLFVAWLARVLAAKISKRVKSN